MASLARFSKASASALRGCPEQPRPHEQRWTGAGDGGELAFRARPYGEGLADAIKWFYKARYFKWQLNPGSV